MITEATHTLTGKKCLKMSSLVWTGALNLLCTLQFTRKAGFGLAGARANSRPLKR